MGTTGADADERWRIAPLARLRHRSFPERERHPGTRTEWVTPDVVWHEVHSQGTWTDTAYRNTYGEDSRTRLDWFAPAVRPAFNQAFAVRNSRHRDFLTINVQAWSPSDDVLQHGGNLEWGSVPTNLKLYQGDKLLGENRFNSDLQWVEVPAGTLPYHLVLDASRPADEWRLSTRTHTEWDFVSSSNEADNFIPFALLRLDYTLETDLHGDVKAGTSQQISVKAGPQPGRHRHRERHLGGSGGLVRRRSHLAAGDAEPGRR